MDVEMEKDQEKMAMVDTVDDLEYYKSVLQHTDAILEGDVLKTLKNFLMKGGKPQEVIKYLSEGYRGYAQMCNLMGHWLRKIGVGDKEIVDIVAEYVRKMIIENFDAKKTDEIFHMDTVSSPAWLEEMIAYPIWRNMIYDLSEKNRDCLLLNFGIQQISTAGHDDEIASLTSAATYFNVFNRVITNTLKKIIERDEFSARPYLNDFKKTCNHSEHTFLYAQSLLYLLQNEENGSIMKRISQELEKSIDGNPLIHKLTFHMTHIHEYSNVQSALLSMLSSKEVSLADIMKLYQAYSSKTPPPVDYIRRKDFFDLLIHDLFDPNKNVDSSYKDQYIFLLAYASCSEDTRKITESNGHNTTESTSYKRPEALDDIIKSLKVMQEICHDNPFGFELKGLSEKIIQHMQYPVVSMGLLYWIRLNLTGQDLLTSTYNTKSHVTLFGLLREIAFINPTQRSEVLDTLVDAFHGKVNMDPIQELNIKKSIIDNIVYLMECGHVFPVLSKLKDWSRNIDQSLTRYFCILIIEMIEPPFSNEFINAFMEIFTTVSIEALMTLENRVVVAPFLNSMYEMREVFNPETKQSVEGMYKIMKNKYP